MSADLEHFVVSHMSDISGEFTYFLCWRWQLGERKKVAFQETM